MKNSIMGFHTSTISRPMSLTDAKVLLRELFAYRDKTGEIRVRPENPVDISKVRDAFLKDLYSGLSKRYRIEFVNRNKGITWYLLLRRESPGYMKPLTGEDKPCSLKAKINPKILAGITDYIAATNESNIEELKVLFDAEAAKISPLLGRFDEYSASRIDFCINGDVHELEIGCTPEQMIALIKRADTAHFEELTKPDPVAHREKTDPYSFYLKSNSVTINCYLPYERQCKDYPNSPNIEKSKTVIRFEAQCKYPKIYGLSQKIKKEGCDQAGLMEKMLSDETSADMVRYYFHKTVGKGDYFTLDGALRMVKMKEFRGDKEQRLIDTLQRVNRCRGIRKAKEELEGNNLEQFKRSLHELNNLGINPVTIPKEWRIEWRTNQWGIRYIPNLLNAFYEEIRHGGPPLTAGMKRHLAKHQSETPAEERIGCWSAIFESAESWAC